MREVRTGKRRIRTIRSVVFVMAGLVAFAAGCKKNEVDKGAFKTALNNYYSSKQECLWSASIKFPAQADASNDDQTKGFDALTDAGMLTRKAVEKKRFLVGSKQANDYDISDKGRSTWTPDQTQPGYGNFCFGHPEVASIDGYTPGNDSATQYTVTYHYSVTLPAWANSTEIKTAFPKLGAETSGAQTASASLTKSNDGWLVQSVQPATAPDDNMPH